MVELKKNTQIAIIALYSPASDKETQSNELKEICKFILNQKRTQKILMLGDFNAPKIAWVKRDVIHPSNALYPTANEPGTDLIFINKIIEEGYEQIFDTPNNRHVFLDLAFANFNSCFKSSEIPPQQLLDHNTTHHKAIRLTFKNSTTEDNTVENSQYEVFDHKNLKLEELKRLLLTIDIDPPEHNLNELEYVNEMNRWGLKINNEIEAAVNKCLPKKMVHLNTWLPPWARESARYTKMVKDKKKLFRKMTKTPHDQEVKATYHTSLKNCQNEYHRITAIAVENIKKEATKNTKSLFSMLNSEKKPKESLPKKMKYNNMTITTNEEKALAFQDLFSAAMSTNTALLTDDAVYDIFVASWSGVNEYLWHDFLNMVNTEEVELAILDMNPNKSPGASNLTVKTAKLVSTELSNIMTKVINTILETSTVPCCWKEALIQPIPKKGKRNEINNYRGIAMQSVI